MHYKNLSFLFFFILFSASAFALQCGDCDGNGFVNILDAHIASRHGAGLITLDEPNFSACNVQGIPGNKYYPKAQVSTLDALTIAQYTVGKIPKLSCILDTPLIFTSRRLGQKEIYTINLDGSDETRIQFNGSFSTQEEHPSFSPDGQWILFSSARDGDLDLYRIRRNAPATAEPEQLTNMTNSEVHARWSPDGQDIVFSGSAQGTFDLYLLNVQTKMITQLTNYSSGEITPSWSPDGTQIAYLRNDVNDFIWRIDRDGQNNIQLTSGLGTDWESAWGVTGKIAFSRFTVSPFGFQIFTINGDGTDLTQITTESGINHRGTSWTRDGSAILFHSDKTGGFDIYSAPPTPSTVTRRITTHAAFDEYPAQ